MRFRTTMLLMVGLTLACAGGEKSETGTADDEAAIRALNTAYGTHWTNADSTAMLAMMTDDYEDVAPDGTHSSGKAAVADMMRKDFTGRPAGMSMSVTTTFVKFLGDDAAVSGGTWTTAGGPPGAPTRGSWSATFRKDADTWKVVSSLGAADMPMPAPMDTTAVMPQ